MIAVPPGAAGTAVATARRSWTFDELRRDALGLRAQLDPGDVAALRSDDAAVVAAAFVALDGWASNVHLLPVDVDAVSIGAPLLALDGFRAERGRGPSREEVGATTWTVYTSGTTGEPKAVGHTAATLARRVVRSERSAALRWGLLYDPNRMAGIQVLLQALLTGAPLVAPAMDSPLAGRVDVLARSSVTALSATPTMWRLILQLPRSGDLDLQQITLGGEIADQPVLDALRMRYPRARIIHVFASTETGSAFSVTDGLAGFPAAFLGSSSAGIALDVRDSILYVHSPGVEGAGVDGFVSTGDVVEVVGDRVLFRGRASGVVNVGGANVWPEEIETILRGHDSVAEVVVSSKPNPMSGNVLVADVVPVGGVAQDGLAKELRAFVRGRAPRTHVPASIRLVESLDVASSGKVARR